MKMAMLLSFLALSGISLASHLSAFVCLRTAVLFALGVQLRLISRLSRTFFLAAVTQNPASSVASSAMTRLGPRDLFQYPEIEAEDLSGMRGSWISLGTDARALRFFFRKNCLAVVQVQSVQDPLTSLSDVGLRHSGSSLDYHETEPQYAIGHRQRVPGPPRRPPPQQDPAQQEGSVLVSFSGCSGAAPQDAPQDMVLRMVLR